MLHKHDLPKWHTYPRYHPRLAVALGSAYTLLQQTDHNPDAYFHAYAVLNPYRKTTVCSEQRMRLEYALAKSYAGEESRSEARECLSRALDVATVLYDCGALVHLGILAGINEHYLSLHAESYRSYSGALTALRRAVPADEPFYPRQEFDLLLRLAGRAFDAGWFPVCLRHLDDAHTLRAVWVPDAPVEAATLSWLDALVSRVIARPVRALTQSAAAAALFADRGDTRNTGRVHTILAECALDIVEYHRLLGTDPSTHWYSPAAPLLAPGTPESALFGIPTPEKAAQHAADALLIARSRAAEADDDVGLGMAALASRRLERLTTPGDTSDIGIATCEDILRLASEYNDPTLWGRAQTYLAEEYGAAGQTEKARAAFETARLWFAEYRMGGMAFWPFRALKAARDLSL